MHAEVDDGGGAEGSAPALGGAQRGRGVLGRGALGVAHLDPGAAVLEPAEEALLAAGRDVHGARDLAELLARVLGGLQLLAGEDLLELLFLLLGEEAVDAAPVAVGVQLVVLRGCRTGGLAVEEGKGLGMALGGGGI